MRRRVLKIGMVLIAVLIAVPFMVIVTVRKGGDSALEAEIAKWEDRGGVPGMAAEQIPGVSAEDNAAVLYIKAIEKATALAVVYETEDEERYFDLEICGDEQLDEIVNLAWRAAQRPQIDWAGASPGNWQGGIAGLANQRALARMLALAAECTAEQGDAEQAGRALAAGLALGTAVSADEPAILSALVTGSIHFMMLYEMQERFRDQELPESNELEDALDSIDYDKMLQRCLRGETAVGLAGFEIHRPSPVLGVAASLAGWSFDADLAFYLQTMRRTLEQLGMEADQRDWAFLSAPPPRNARLSEIVLPSIETAITSFAKGEARLLLAKEAIKLRRHRAQHGSYPDSWPMPTDPATGGPLHYMRDGNGFLMWSEAEVKEYQEPIEWRWK